MGCFKFFVELTYRVGENREIIHVLYWNVWFSLRASRSSRGNFDRSFVIILQVDDVWQFLWFGWWNSCVFSRKCDTSTILMRTRWRTESISHFWEVTIGRLFCVSLQNDLRLVNTAMDNEIVLNSLNLPLSFLNPIYIHIYLNKLIIPTNHDTKNFTARGPFFVNRQSIPLPRNIKSNPLRRRRADIYTLKIVSDAKTIFVALLTIFDSMKLNMASEEKVDMLENLCAHCWIIGSSEILAEIDVIKTAGKLGEYCRGIADLFCSSQRRADEIIVVNVRILRGPPTSNRKVELCNAKIVPSKPYISVLKVEISVLPRTNYIRH